MNDGDEQESLAVTVVLTSRSDGHMLNSFDVLKMLLMPRNSNQHRLTK